ncbi:MAG: hypothetical protein KF891_03235 [Rhizobacter sp.]|nr:hypothetical protein [Rhizobacter sp.]
MNGKVTLEVDVDAQTGALVEEKAARYPLDPHSKSVGQRTDDAPAHKVNIKSKNGW